MAVPRNPTPAVRGGPLLTVSWRAPGSETWRRFEEPVARAILARAACASGQATFEVEEIVRRSPRLGSEERKTKRARLDDRPSKESERETLLVMLKSVQNGVAVSKASCAIRWGFSSMCTFDRLPNTARALAAMVSECEPAKTRQILSQLLDYVISEERLEHFLSTVDVSDSAAMGYPKPRNTRISRLTANASARPGGALYERFLDAALGRSGRSGRSGHVSHLAGALQALMGSPSQSIAPLTFAFHGTPPANVPSILAKGMLPEKRIASGDFFATSPWTSVPYCRKFCSNKQPPYRLILFLLLPVSPAVICNSGGYVVMKDERYELPLGTFELDYDLQESGPVSMNSR